MLAAVADAEEIEVTDDELVDALGPGEGDEDPASSSTACASPAATRSCARTSGCARRPTLIVESAKPIPVEQAAARETIWTPEKGAAEEAPQAEEAKANRGRAREDLDAGLLSWSIDGSAEPLL